MQLPSQNLALSVALVFVLALPLIAEEHKNASALPPETTSLTPSTTTTPSLSSPSFLGVYSADGYFRSSNRPPTSPATITEPIPRLHGRPLYVPRFVDLHASESVIEDIAPPSRARRAPKGKSIFAHLRDAIVTAAYGHEQVLLTPTQVITDSRQRLIISDPLEPALHVLDGNNSFRIEGGPQHRLRHPSGIAVDSHDNIYVADEKLGIVLVYNSDGQFLRNIGDFHGESMFQRPTGIAIDRAADLLYVLDSPMNEIVVLNLEGRTVRRIGGPHGRNTSVKLDNPTAIAVANNSIAVLDTFDSRIVVLDLKGNLQTEFPVRQVRIPSPSMNIGIALDSANNLYASHPESGDVRIYSPHGELIGKLQEDSRSNGRIQTPTGVWVDQIGRVLVADTGQSSIHLYQVRSGTSVTASSSLP